MTRADVAKLFAKHMPDVRNPERTIDFYVEAGMLALDAPKTKRELFEEAMGKAGYHPNSKGMTDALTAFDACEK